VSLSIPCPHCTIPTSDSWDLLEEDTIHEMTCQFCKRTFAMSFFECLKCAEDNVLTGASPADISDKVRVCSKCGSTHQEWDSDGEATHL
jgi:transcription elongation factor Elf1